MDEGSRDKFVESHIDFAHRIALRLRRRYGFPPSVAVDDLKAFAVQGLIEAASRFDPAMGRTFEAFAQFRIKGAVLNGVKQMQGLDAKFRQQAKAAEAALDVLPNDDDAPQARSASQAAMLFNDAVRKVTTVVSLCALSGDEADAAYDPSDHREEDAGESNAEREFLARMDRVVADLDDDDRQLIQWRFVEGRSLEEIAKLLNKAHKTTAMRRLERLLNAVAEKLGVDRPKQSASR